jgi:hypothetical protein
MNKNTTIKVLTGILLALATGASAQTALQQLGAEAGNDTVALARQFQDMRAKNYAPAPAPVIGLRRESKDVFSGCESFEAKPFMAWNLPQAALIVQTCLNNAYPADGAFTVRAAVARFSVRACPDGSAAACRAIVEVEGIKISVDGTVPGDAVLQDLNAAIAQRGGKLLNYYATVDAASAQIVR